MVLITRLLMKLMDQHQNIEMRFSILKLVVNILSQLLNDPAILEDKRSLQRLHDI